MNAKKRIAVAIATGALLLNAFAPLAFADTSIVISGNGSNSNNTTNVVTSTNTTVQQSNSANVTNNVTSNATTGGNDASANTGGNVTVSTGNANNNTTVSTAVNANQAQVSGCGTCNGGNTSVTVSGNGSDSNNQANLTTGNETNVVQGNQANVKNNVNASSNTGSNDASANTGGDVTVRTGSASSNANVSTTANANVAQVGGNGGSGSLSLVILGNGTESQNSIGLSSDNSVLLWQGNSAVVTNNVNANAKTGNNDASANTGGNVTVSTGNADAGVNVDNMVNFNSAEAGCGCDVTVLAKVAGNGEDTQNNIYADLGNSLGVFQDVGEGMGAENMALLTNNANATSGTGGNNAGANTGLVSGDAVYEQTGNATNSTNVDNSGNVNVFGSVLPLPMPFSNLSFSANFSAVWAAWGAFLSNIGA